MTDVSQELWRDHARTTRSIRDLAVGAGTAAAMKQLPDAIRVAHQTDAEAVLIDVRPIVDAVLEKVASGLSAAIECVLLDHVDQLEGWGVDPNLAELAHVYEQLTGWTAQAEQAKQ